MASIFSRPQWVKIKPISQSVRLNLLDYQWHYFLTTLYFCPSMCQYTTSLDICLLVFLVLFSFSRLYPHSSGFCTASVEMIRLINSGWYRSMHGVNLSRTNYTNYTATSTTHNKSVYIFRFLQMQATYFILWCSLCYQLDDGSASTMQKRHLSCDKHILQICRHGENI